MSSFTEPLSYRSTHTFVGGRTRRRLVEIDGKLQEVTELTSARRVFEITRAFRYESEGAGGDVPIPEGFRTDLGSIPFFARVFLSPDDPWAQAYVVHDWHYGAQAVPRETADLALWEALGIPFRTYTADGRMLRALCPRAYRWLIWAAVRLGGRYGDASRDDRPTPE